MRLIEVPRFSDWWGRAGRGKNSPAFVLFLGVGVLISLTGLRCEPEYPLQVGFQNALPGTTLEVERQEVVEESDVLRIGYGRSSYELVGQDQCDVFSFTAGGTEVIPAQELCGGDYLVVRPCLEGGSREPCVEKQTVIELDISIEEDLLR